MVLMFRVYGFMVQDYRVLDFCVYGLGFWVEG